MQKEILIFLIALLLPTALFAQQSGAITGTVIDRDTRETLIGVNVVISSTGNGAATNTEGTFTITGVKPGIYVLNVSYIGYEQRTITDVVVHPGKTTNVPIQLTQNYVEGQEITVTSGYFQNKTESRVSRVKFGPEEIRRSPGSGQEISRVLNSVAGVATPGETSQDLLVRGGSPSEVGFYIENIPMPGIAHFRNENGASNGPIGIINTELVDDLTFSTGGFDASYGGVLSGVGNISYRDPNRENYQGQAALNLAGFGGLLEGPVTENSAILVSVRRSYLDVIADAINAGGAPSYGDAHLKYNLDLDKNNRLTFLNIYGQSAFMMDRQDALDGGLNRITEAQFRQNTTGVNWRRFWSKDLYSNTSLSYSIDTQDIDVVLTEDGTTDFDSNNGNQRVAMRNVTFWNLSKKHKFEFGSDLQWLSGDYDYRTAAGVDRTGTPQPARSRNLTISGVEAALFASHIWRPGSNLTLTSGARLNYDNFNGNLYLAPRGALNYDLTSKLTYKLSGGLFYQSVPLYFRSQNSAFEELEDILATHLITGFDYLLTPATKLTLELYAKQYANAPIQPNNPAVPDLQFVLDGTRFYESLQSTGEAEVQGIDLMIQKKMAENFYGSASVSYFRSRFRDFNGNWQNRDFDVRYLLNVIGGYRPNNKYEVSVRWSMLGGRPTTPVDPTASAQVGETVRNFAQFNDTRLPAYHSLFLRVDRRFYFNKMSLTTFFTLWNAYNRANVLDRYYNTVDNKIDDINQFSILPVGGFEIEF